MAPNSNKCCATCDNKINGWCDIWNCAVEDDVSLSCEFYSSDTLTLGQQINNEL